MLNRLFDPSPKAVTINIAIHVLLGVISTLSKFPLIGWFYLIVFYGVGILLSPNRHFPKYIALIVYLTSFDVISRMTKTSPFIPYELSKYLTLLLALWGLIRCTSYSKYYIIGAVLLVPAFFVEQMGYTEISDWINNGIAPINLWLLVALFYKQQITPNTLFSLLRPLLYTTLMVLAFAYFKTPDYDKIDFNLSANFATTGGFGSNQVSTMLGLGGFIIALYLVLGKTLSGFKWLDIGLLFAFIFQGLLTFSRGGVLGMVLAIGVFIYYASNTNAVRASIKVSRSKLLVYTFVAILVGLIGFLVVDNITGNSLSLRYKGETAGTAGGYREKDLNVITSNRFDILMGDIELWASEPIFGVGVGASKYFRSTVEGTVAHVEFSRLLAEHGLLGLIVFIWWLLLFFQIRRNNKDPLMIAILSALFLLALYTSFHAAMRTYITPLLTGLSMLSIVAPKPKVSKVQQHEEATLHR